MGEEKFLNAIKRALRDAPPLTAEIRARAVGLLTSEAA